MKPPEIIYFIKNEPSEIMKVSWHRLIQIFYLYFLHSYPFRTLNTLHLLSDFLSHIGSSVGTLGLGTIKLFAMDFLENLGTIQHWPLVTSPFH